MTKATSQRARCLVIEDLNVSGMLKNRTLSRAIADVGLYEFRRQLTYKAQAVGLPIKVVSRWYPSSKRCSCCGWIDEQQTLADRTFICQRCGIVLDRDFNAACNLAAFGEQEPPTVSFTGSHAWGDWRSGLLVTTGETPVREPGTKHCF